MTEVDVSSNLDLPVFPSYKTDEGVRVVSLNFKFAQKYIELSELPFSSEKVKQLTVEFDTGISKGLFVSPECLFVSAHGSSEMVEFQYFNEDDCLETSHLKPSEFIDRFINSVDLGGIESIFLYSSYSSYYASALAKESKKSVFGVEGSIRARVVPGEQETFSNCSSTILGEDLAAVQNVYRELLQGSVKKEVAVSSLFEKCKEGGVAVPKIMEHHRGSVLEMLKGLESESSLSFPFTGLLGDISLYMPNGSVKSIDSSCFLGAIERNSNPGYFPDGVPRAQPGSRDGHTVPGKGGSSPETSVQKLNCL